MEPEKKGAGQMERCPVCRKRFFETQLCSRCGADLSVLVDIEQNFDFCLLRAVGCLGEDRFEDARAWAEKAVALRQTTFSLALADFCRKQASGQRSYLPR